MPVNTRMKGLTMLLSTRTVRRAVAGVIAAGPMGAAMLFGFAPSAFGQPPTPAPPAPPGCSAADLARVSAGVASATSDYLYGHPDVNNFFTSLHGLPSDEVPNDVRNYMDANPQVRSDLTAIRQPLTDLRNGCQ
jgi:hemophore-related protein